MRTITIQTHDDLAPLVDQQLVQLIVAMPIGGRSIYFDGDLSNGRIVSRVGECEWVVSFRPSPGGRNARHYTSPYVVARVILSHPRQHDEAAAIKPDRSRGGVDVTAELLACTGMEPQP